MSQPILIPSDDAIERALASRASQRPTGGLLEGVMTRVHTTKQVSRRGATLRDPVGGASHARIWMAVAAAVLIVGGSVSLSTGGRLPAVFPPAPTSPAQTLPAAVVAPTPSASAAPSATARPSASALTCATQTTSVLTGDAMPQTAIQPMTVTSDALQMGVYLTATDTREDGAQTDVWAVTSGHARRIASIIGPDYNQANVDDVTVDGSTALISVGVIHGGNPGPECSDLYIVRTDGSGATRLTFNGPGEWDSSGWGPGGQFSPDGQFVAFISGEAGATTSTIGLMSLQGDATETDIMCGESDDVRALAWSPSGDRLAAVCGATVLVVTVGGSPARAVGSGAGYTIPTNVEAFVGVGWQDAHNILVMAATPGQSENGPINLTTLTFGQGAEARTGTWSPVIPTKPALMDPGLSTPIVISPDGQSVAIFGDPVRDDPSDASLALYVADTSSGIGRRVADWGTSDVTWTSDGRSLLFSGSVDGQLGLIIHDLDTKRGQPIGILPIETRGSAVWRVK